MNLSSTACLSLVVSHYSWSQQLRLGLVNKCSLACVESRSQNFLRRLKYLAYFCVQQNLSSKPNLHQLYLFHTLIPELIKPIFLISNNFLLTLILLSLVLYLSVEFCLLNELPPLQYTVLLYSLRLRDSKVFSW
jgi:hypothetical protein